MPNNLHSQISYHSIILKVLFFILAGTLGFHPAVAQESSKIQELTGIIEPGEIIIYDLPNPYDLIILIPQLLSLAGVFWAFQYMQ